MLGFVEDLTPYYEQCRLAIAPLRYGAGVKGKVNQALSFGLPVSRLASRRRGHGAGPWRECDVRVDAARLCRFNTGQSMTTPSCGSHSRITAGHPSRGVLPPKWQRQHCVQH